jgi:predicted NBD/HSP70 family sugar kinase
VDNDVNWAARAERRAATGEGPDDFAYVHLGEGLGCAVVSDGEVRRGHGGIAGEIAHVVTRGKGGRAVHFTEVFAELGLRRTGTTAIDVERLLAAAAGDDARSARFRAALAEAICGVLAAVVAVADPETVVLGGSWGPAILPDVAAAFADRPRHVPLRAAQVTDEPSLLGARQQALDDLQEAILALVVMDLDGRS